MKKNKKYITDKSIFGIKKINGKMIFYKILNKTIDDEINGYNLLKNNYRVPSRIFYNQNSVYYEYKKELINNTLHDYLYKKTFLSRNLNEVLNQYAINLKKTKKKDESELQNSKFFVGRSNKINDCLKLDIFNKHVIFNSCQYNIKEILIETEKKLVSSKKLFSFISQGDPTDTNISIMGTFTDFENAGYNSIVGEIAIAIASFCTHGCYFYPKYNFKAYEIRPLILKKYNKYKCNIEYKIEQSSLIIISSSFKISKKNKKFICSFLKTFNDSLSNNIKKEISKYLKYYLCMRMITPIDLQLMDVDDQVIITQLIINFYYNSNSLSSIINYISSLEEF